MEVIGINTHTVAYDYGLSRERSFARKHNLTALHNRNHRVIGYGIDVTGDITAERSFLCGFIVDNYALSVAFDKCAACTRHGKGTVKGKEHCAAGNYNVIGNADKLVYLIGRNI